MPQSNPKLDALLTTTGSRVPMTTFTLIEKIEGLFRRGEGERGTTGGMEVNILCARA